MASPFLTPEHWANDALRRLGDLRLLPRGFDPSIESRSRFRAAQLFIAARDSARSLRSSRLVDLIDGYLQQFRQEYPGAVDEAMTPSRPSGLALTSASVAGGYQERAGVLDVTAGRHSQPAPDLASGTATLETTVRFGSHLTATLVPSIDDRGSTLVTGYGAATLGPLALWAGRRAIGFGAGFDGNIVLSPTTFTGGGVVLVKPWVAPGVLRHLGPIQFESFLSRTQNTGGDVGRPITNPLIWGNHLSLSPIRSLTIGATRVFLMAGQGNEPARAQYFLRMLVGAYNHWHSETASVDVRWRTPLRIFPLVAYMEWGMETASGAFFKEPARDISLEVPAVPSIPWLGLGLERIGFHGSIPGTGAWYGSQFGMWADAGQPMGHPLGGHGHEYALHVSADPANARLRVSALAFLRDRGNENLYRQLRKGVSRGGWVRAGWSFTDHLDLSLDGYYERGTDWTETKLDTSVRWLVPLKPGR